ncbi:hypothetical protein JKP88DRAFT_176875 [Tribonema minus]|uniref:ABC transporter domain-containing protein n=1 Tax=Tribonema minus TaxID=303371 RepID=A0A835ZC31_9STRA|nr:hypothetical protein JKP88DRAFT_176875 [Tribonema minus]
MELFPVLTQGPFPVPSLDLYISVGSYLEANLDAGDYDYLIKNSEPGRMFSNLLSLGALHFAPAGSAAVQELQLWLDDNVGNISNVTRRLHATEDDAVQYVLDHLEEKAWAVIAIDEAAPGDVDYTIRLNYTTLPNTNIITDFLAVELTTEYAKYYASGFLTLQTTLDKFFFDYTVPAAAEAGAAGGQCSPPDVLGIPMPTPYFNQNTFFTAVGFLLGLSMTLSTLFPVSRLVSRVVEEKETRVRETMKIMGLGTGAHDLSWFLLGSFTAILLAIGFTVVSSLSFLPSSEASLLFVFFLVFLLGEVNFALLMSCFFNKAKLAAIVGPVALFATVLPRYIFFGTNRYEEATSKYAWSLLSPTAFAFGADFIADYEFAGVGANWSNYSEGDFSLASCMGMLVFDFFLYGLLAWYLDKVLPRQFGTPRHPLFFLRCCRRRRQQRRGSGGADGSEERAALAVSADLGDGGHGAAVAQARSGNFEEVPAQVAGKGRVELVNLTKRYGSKYAVQGVNLSMYEGHITCYLGHNGAGKSTTIGACTGLTPPTSGDCLVWGRSVLDSHDLDAIRQDMGLCPQHDTLFPLLTVREHLQLFCAIKGIPARHTRGCVEHGAAEVGLTEKLNSLSSTLSGGQKRKLSLALALTADPRFLLCDEPTSGVDPYSRRAIWDVLRKNKPNRVVLLTTHYMDEADRLADRIAIINHGRLQCVGSPLFLKTRFGLGYNLSLVKASGAFSSHDMDSLVQRHVPDAKLLSAAAGEVTYRLPFAQAGLFAGLFRQLEQDRSALGEKLLSQC